MRLRLLPVAVLIVAAGCGDKSMPMAASPETAKPALVAVLDAWKAGKSEADLKAQTPPVIFNDADFKRGRKLSDYKIEGDGGPMGAGMRYDVTLTFDDEKAKAKGKGAVKVAYRVVTDPTTSIYREDF